MAMMERRLIGYRFALALLLVLASSEAWAQAAVFQSMARQSEELCQRGYALPPNITDLISKKSDDLLAAYEAAARTQDQGALTKLFWRDRAAGWRGPEGLQPIATLQDPWLSGNSAPLVRDKLVVANDLTSARGVWTLRVADPAAPDAPRTMVYTVDLKRDLVLGRAWKIWRLRISDGADAPPVPERFCHISEIAPLL